MVTLGFIFGDVVEVASLAGFFVTVSAGCSFEVLIESACRGASYDIGARFFSSVCDMEENPSAMSPRAIRLIIRARINCI